VLRRNLLLVVQHTNLSRTLGLPYERILHFITRQGITFPFGISDQFLLVTNLASKDIKNVSTCLPSTGSTRSPEQNLRVSSYIRTSNWIILASSP
jgi:hypothetical protein